MFSQSMRLAGVGLTCRAVLPLLLRIPILVNPPGLEGEPLNDYLHNLRMLCGEDPNNDMVNPPQQAMPGIEAILGALQAQGTNPQQQQFLQAAAAAARSQNQQQLNLQLRNAGLNNLPGATQQALAQQRLGQQVNRPSALMASLAMLVCQ